MHSRFISTAACLSVLGSAALVLAQAPAAPTEIRKHHNPVIDLLGFKTIDIGRRVAGRPPTNP